MNNDNDEQDESKISIGEILMIILAIFFFMQFLRPPEEIYKETPGCFPDYRPMIKCQAFEKLPY